MLPITAPFTNNTGIPNYRLEAPVALEEMLETSMNTATYKKVIQPTLMLYYYKDDIHQDSVVKVTAMKEMFATLATDSLHKKAVDLAQCRQPCFGVSH
ncbi:MAG: hypothetical protein WDM90_24720 [Ferruginibacter sp.]